MKYQNKINVLLNKRKIIVSIFSKMNRLIPFEALVWTAGLIALILISPNEDQHFSFCLFNNIGIDFCPGCGLGRSISYLFRGNFIASFKAHPLGVLALSVLLARIYSLMKRQTQNYQSNKSEV